jgi:hypothetical protein
VLARIDTSFASVYGLQLIAGRGFEEISADVPEGQPQPVIANESAIRAVGFDTPNFAYRINIGWWIFALDGGLALLIALLTVSSQAIKAALANPVEALRYE